MMENYSWVDDCLRQLYYRYAFTLENFDEYEYAGLLTEKWAWVDETLEEMCIREDRMPILAPIEWTQCSYDQLVCIEELIIRQPEKRTRFESDISDYEDCINTIIRQMNQCIIKREAETKEI